MRRSRKKSLNTFEKTLFLKSVPLFKYVKDEALLAIASAFEEQRAAPKEEIIQKDELGTDMYLIVSGKVKVHDGDHQIAELKIGDVFGELAALAPEKRIASVQALEDTLLLKIGSRTLYDLIDIQPGLAKGIIQALCQRVRTIALSNLNS